MSASLSWVLKQDGESAARLSRMRKSMEVLGATVIKVGFPKGGDIISPAKKGSGHEPAKEMADIAKIAAINDADRPFLKAGVAAGSTKIKAAMFHAALQVIDKDASPIDASAVVGEVAAAAVRNFIITGPHKPNAESTKRLKNSSSPLIDTGQMKASVTFSIESGE